MAIATELIYWSDSDGARTMKLVRAAYAQRQAAILDPSVFIVMIGMFPKSTASAFSNRAKADYVQRMREGRDRLISCGVWENAIDGYIPFQEAPTTEFVYTVTVDKGLRKNPFPSLESMTLDEAVESAGSGGGDKEPLFKRKFVVDPFDDDGVTVKAQLELDLVEASGRRLNAPGEFSATLEVKNGRLVEVGAEWTGLKKRLKDRIARGAIRNVEITITVAGKTDLSEATARQIFGAWSAEAKATLGADLHVGKTKVRVEIGAKGDTEHGLGPSLEFTF